MTFAIVDADGSGEVDFAEFSAWWETPDGKMVRGEDPNEVTSNDFKLQELIEAVEARMRDRASLRDQETYARKKRLGAQQERWAKVRADRAAIEAAKQAAIAAERRMQDAAVEKLRLAQHEEERLRMEELERQRQLAWEARQAALRSAGDRAAGDVERSVGVVNWLPVEALKKEAHYRDAEADRAKVAVSVSRASLLAVARPPQPPGLKKTAGGKAGDGNSSGNANLRFFPVVNAVLHAK